MSIIDNILASLEHDVPVRSVLIGAHWTAVCSRHCGLATTMMDDCVHGHVRVRDAGHLHRKSACELAEYALSDNPLEVSIGIAAVNSLLDVDESQSVEINALDVLAERGRGKTVALVGHFPFIPKLRSAVEQLWVIEQRPADGEYSAEAGVDLIPQADVVAVTGSAIINHTLDGWLKLCKPEVPVMVLGPSTPFSPVLYDFGVTFLAGTQVIDEAAVLRTVGQGATFQQVEGTRLLTLERKQTVELDRE